MVNFNDLHYINLTFGENNFKWMQIADVVSPLPAPGGTMGLWLGFQTLPVCVCFPELCVVIHFTHRWKVLEVETHLL